MGYTHYWYRPKKLGNKKTFKAFLSDVEKIINFSEKEFGIKIANGCGEPDTEPTLTEKLISFNGSDAQPKGMWTTNEDIIIPWPSDTASLYDNNPLPDADKTDGVWFAGTQVSQRVAPVNNLTGLGSGSYETVYIPFVLEDETERGLIFQCCKTAYRPYDLTATAVLVALKHHFPKCKIKSDGKEKDWIDGRHLCHDLFGYGLDFKIDE